jgi:uncharacterized membrane protein YfcA
VALCFGGRLARGRFKAPPWAPLIAQVPLSLYGGYFGGALGLMAMATWMIMGNLDLKAMNPLKVLLTGVTNLAAVGCFAISGAVAWPPTLAMLAGAVLGGAVGGRLARRLSPLAVRATTILVTGAVTVAFFVRGYG